MTLTSSDVEQLVVKSRPGSGPACLRIQKEQNSDPREHSRGFAPKTGRSNQVRRRFPGNDRGILPSFMSPSSSSSSSLIPAAPALKDVPQAKMVAVVVYSDNK